MKNGVNVRKLKEIEGNGLTSFADVCANLSQFSSQ